MRCAVVRRVECSKDKCGVGGKNDLSGKMLREQINTPARNQPLFGRFHEGALLGLPPWTCLAANTRWFFWRCSAAAPLSCCRAPRAGLSPAARAPVCQHLAWTCRCEHRENSNDPPSPRSTSLLPPPRTSASSYPRLSPGPSRGPPPTPAHRLPAPSPPSPPPPTRTLTRSSSLSSTPTAASRSVCWASRAPTARSSP
jgi:hypothetical protein